MVRWSFYYYPELTLISYEKPIEKYPGLGPNPRSTHTISSLLEDVKIEKFDTKTKLKKQANSSVTGRNFRFIEWYTKKHMCISRETIHLIIVFSSSPICPHILIFPYDNLS
jgi:hypothetical protein